MFGSTGGNSAVFISDSPMNLGVRFLVSHLQAFPAWEVYGLLAEHPDFTRIEAPYSADELICLRSELARVNPRIIGLSSTERTRSRLLASLHRIKESLPSALYLAGGIDAIADPDFYFSKEVDLVCLGDGEIPTESLLKLLSSGATNESILRNPPPGFISHQNRNSLPAPSPQIIPLPYYGERMLTLTPTGMLPADVSVNSAHVQFLHRASAIDMFTQRGCTHKCKFCAQDLLLIYNGDSRRNNTNRRSLADAVAHIAGIKARYSQKDFVYLWDLDFLRWPHRELRDFAAEYRRHVGLPYFIFVTEKSVNSAGKDVLKILVDAGLHTINMGIQSGNKRVLHELYGRNNTPEDAMRAIQLIDEATTGSAVETIFDIITYNPREEPEEILDSIKLVCRIPPGDGRRRVRLSTHVFSQNTGQELYSSDPTRRDYQDFMSRDVLQGTQSPYLSFLLGHMMRGELTAGCIGNVRRSSVPELIRPDMIEFMDRDPARLAVIYEGLVPQDSSIFLGR